MNHDQSEDHEIPVGNIFCFALLHSLSWLLSRVPSTMFFVSGGKEDLDILWDSRVRRPRGHPQ